MLRRVLLLPLLLCLGFASRHEPRQLLQQLLFADLLRMRLLRAARLLAHCCHWCTSVLRLCFNCLLLVLVLLVLLLQLLVLLLLLLLLPLTVRHQLAEHQLKVIAAVWRGVRARLLHPLLLLVVTVDTRAGGLHRACCCCCCLCHWLH
jgi:hypothetical protein